MSSIVSFSPHFHIPSLPCRSAFLFLLLLLLLPLPGCPPNHIWTCIRLMLCGVQTEVAQPSPFFGNQVHTETRPPSHCLSHTDKAASTAVIFRTSVAFPHPPNRQQFLFRECCVPADLVEPLRCCGGFVGLFLRLLEQPCSCSPALPTTTFSPPPLLPLTTTIPHQPFTTVKSPRPQFEGAKRETFHKSALHLV